MREYLGIVLKKIQNNKLETINKVAGLTIAVVACLLIAFYVYDEYRYDHFHSKKDRVYRLVRDNQVIWSTLAFPYLKDQVAGIEKVAGILGLGAFQESTFTVNQTPFLEKEVYVFDPDILDILDFNIIGSQSREALVAPNTMIISRSLAEKFFNKENPIGQTVKFLNSFDLTISGVFEDFPAQSHINPKCLISRSTPLAFSESNHWGDQGFNIYVLLSPNASPEDVAARVREVIFNAAGDVAEWLYGDKKFSLQPLTDIHLHSSDFQWDFVKKGDIDFVRMIMLIGILILLVAATNHINLTVTQTMGETKQFAVMKTMGGLPRQIRQYIYAGILLDVAISAILAAFVAVLILPVFGNLVGKQFTLGLQTCLYMVCLLVAIVATVTFITGVYPAHLFARVPVMRIFQNSYKVGGEYLRKGLVVFQFTVSVILIASTIFMYRQMQLLTSQKLGFNKEQLLVIDNPITMSNDQSEMFSLLVTQYERFKTITDRLPSVESIGSAQNAPAGMINNTTSIKTRGSEESYRCSVVPAFVGFLPTLQADFIAGNDFTEAVKDGQIIVTRKLAEELGETPESIIGKNYEFGMRGQEEVQVIGVVEDIQYYAHRTSEERPGILFFYSSYVMPRNIVVRTSKGDWRNAITQLEKAWQEAVPAFPLSYQFMNERLENNYKKELADIGTVNAFSIVAIVLSCFGVMGISRYTARKRTKEIAIRKVNGASKMDIMVLLNSNFMVLNLIAFVIAIPVVIVFINNWLQNFSYKINLSWWVFALAGVGTAIIVFATVSLQSWRAASANPAKSLKSE